MQLAVKRSAVRLLLFAKAAVPGQVKTRLVPALGEQGACELHDKLVRHTIASLNETDAGSLRLYVDHPLHAAVVNWCGGAAGISVHEQCSGNLGARMRRAVEQTAREKDVENLLLLGSDCPFIDVAFLDEALQEIAAGASVVFGPAEDGGYVLLGLSRAAAEDATVLEALFSGIEWGSDKVLEQSLQALARCKVSVAMLPALADIDRPADLALLDSVNWKV